MAELSDAAVAGVYLSEQGDLSHRTQPEVWLTCVKGALADAGLTLDDVDGLIGPAPEGLGLREALPGSTLATMFGHPLRFHASTAIGASAQSAGVGLAALAIAHGMAEVVIVPTASAGVAAGYASANRDDAIAKMAMLGSPYEYIWGTTRVADYAVVAQRHMYEFGTTQEQLAEIAVAQRYGATLHPLSMMGKRGEISIDDVMNSRMIASPLKILDSCLINQGGGCIVVAKTSAVKAIGKHAPVSVIGWGEGHGYLDPLSAPSIVSFAGKLAADTAFSMAGVSREQINVAAIADHFTINVLVELEDAGFCKKGEGGAFVENQGLRIGGRLPTNTAGGFLSFSHAASCGLYSMIELVTQLRHEAGARQVANAQYGYSCGVGGVSHNQYGAVLARV
ncbi:MAG: hypothetical protein AB7L13_16465 [Acidimicrobiia bacterium]